MRSFPWADTRLRSSSRWEGRYPDLFGEGEHVKGVEGVGDVGECYHKVMWLSYCEVFEGDFCWFRDEGFFSFEAFLFFGHIEPMELPGLFCFFFLKNGQLSNIELSLFVFFWGGGTEVHLKVIILSHSSTPTIILKISI